MSSAPTAAGPKSLAADRSSGPITPARLAATIIVAVVVGVVVLARSDQNAIGEYGLIQALPVLYYLAVLVVLVAMLLALCRNRQSVGVLATGAVALVLLIQGSATLIEDEGRFPVAWLHAGFIESITSLGHTTPSFDARFSWPGFFSGAGVLTELTGVPGGATFWIRWAPVVLTLAYLPSLLAIGRATLHGWRAPWIGLIVFVFVDWVGQDYFSPQTVAFVLMLAFLAIVLTWFRKCEPGRLSRRLQAWADRRSEHSSWGVAAIVRRGGRELEPPARDARVPVRLGLLFGLVVITFALVASHQLTPAVLIATIGVLAIFGRFRPWPLVGFTGVAMVGFVSYAAYAFWSGHLSEIFGGIGHFGAVVDSGVSDRIEGSVAHLRVLDVRMAFALLVWLLAVAGAVRLWRSGGIVSVTLLVLMVTPVFIAGTQGYGGEGILRMFFFSLPGASLLIAGLISPTASPPRGRVLVAVAMLICLSFPAFLLAKWGNEDFERISTQDVELEAALYQLAPLGSTLGGLGYGGPGPYQDLTEYSYAPGLLDSWPVTDVAKVDSILGDNPIGTYLSISRPEIAYGVVNDGLPADFADSLIAMMVASKEYQIVYQNPAGVILKRIPTATPAPATKATP